MTMKMRYINMFVLFLSAALSCVQMDEGDLGVKPEPVEMVPMTVSATIEKDVQTKTALEGSLSDALMRTVWMSGDSIGILAVRSGMDSHEPVYEFVTDIEDNSETAIFHGVAALSSDYYAFYPYDASLKFEDDGFVFELPQIQRYVPGSFDSKAAPMVAKTSYGEAFDFQNLCGLLAVQLKGEASVQSVTFIGKNAGGVSMPVAGRFSVDMNYDADPLISVQTSMESVTLQCEIPVTLSKDEAVPFYFVLPPVVYDSFIITVKTSDGKMMVKKGNRPLTVSRSHIKPAAALQYAESVYFDLSKSGNANCYVISESGLYAFDADVIGNGDFGLIQGVDFPVDDVHITPHSVEVIWEDGANLLTDLVLADGCIRFFATGNEGNAVVAVKDISGAIIWSWHLWFTDSPSDQKYVNSAGTFVMQDRNLGATRADRGEGDQWKESSGLLYEWGRKDPFADGKYERLDVQLYMSEVISMPNTYVCDQHPWTKEWNDLYWSPEVKTIFDPCPVGYKVPINDVWKGFTSTGENVDRRAEINASGSFDYGWNFLIDDDGNTAWYPSTPHIGFTGLYEYHSDSGYCWYAGAGSSILDYYYNSDLKCHVRIKDRKMALYDAYPVRCMKDE